MKKFLISAIVALMALTANAQIYDGITQPERFRVLVPATIAVKDGNTTVAPFFGYKYEPVKWFSVTGILQYNINKNDVIPQVWLNFNVKDIFYILSRSIYDTRENAYKHTLSASVKIPLGFMIDATWSNLYDGHSFCGSDRLQVLGGFGYKWFVVNAGYSFRHMPGVIVNARFKMTKDHWFQLKYDGGLNCFQTSLVFNFSGRHERD